MIEFDHHIMILILHMLQQSLQAKKQSVQAPGSIDNYRKKEREADTNLACLDGMYIIVVVIISGSVL